MRGDDRHADKASHQRRWLACLVTLLGALMAAAWTASAVAYTAAGDRTFVTTLLLPQIAPSDELYFTWSTLPQIPSVSGDSRTSNATVVYDKTITDRLGIQVEETYTRNDQVGAPPFLGWQNTDTVLKYMAVNNGPHEFLLSLGVDREFGGTGARRVDASPSGATTPEVFFGKGLGDLDIGLLRPIALTGFAGPQVADQSRRADMFMTGFAVEYSIPYLESKVQSFALPNLIRAMTPITEVLVMTPFGSSSQQSHTEITVAPGVVYSGQGWEAGIEAQIPMTRATGRGVGVIAQIHFSLDYLFPETIGKPLFGRPY